MIEWCQTASGIPFYPLNPRMEDVRIEDIAHALANMCRFAGHTREFYSVAQHCVLASEMVEWASYEDPNHEALYALLHDASEAYIVDVPRPLKHQPEFAGYILAESRLQTAIYSAFGLDPVEPGLLHVVDHRMLRTEQRDLMPPACNGDDRHDVEPYPDPIEPWTPTEARKRFLARFKELTGRPVWRKYLRLKWEDFCA